MSQKPCERIRVTCFRFPESCAELVKTIRTHNNDVILNDINVNRDRICDAVCVDYVFVLHVPVPLDEEEWEKSLAPDR